MSPLAERLAARPRIAAFSGGALRSFAGLGVAACFRERGLLFDHFSGCSGGAIVAAVLAAGIPPREALVQAMDRARGALRGGDGELLLHLIHPFFGGRGGGLLDPLAVGRALTALLPEDGFDGLPRGLAVNAVHLLSGTEVLFTGTDDRLFAGASPDLRFCRRQPVSAAVAASIALPGLFRPARLEACCGCRGRECGIPVHPAESEGRWFVDGGLRSHMPLRYFPPSGRSFLLGVNVRLEGTARGTSPGGWSLLDLMHRAADVVLQEGLERALREIGCGSSRTVCLSPPLWDVGLFDSGREALERSFRSGYLTARMFLDSLSLPDFGNISWDGVLGRLPEPVTILAPETV